MFDSLIFSQINSLAFNYAWLDILAMFFAIYVIFILPAVLSVFLIKNFKKYIKPVIGSALSAVLGGGLVLIANLVFYRARPFAVEDVNLLLSHLSNSSFPSFHTTTLFALSFFLCLYGKSHNQTLLRKLGCAFLGISFLVGVSRVFVGVHWPADILAGILLGGLCGWIVYKFFSNH
ncbi:MAG: phosphatase PAP2 family protein [Parcubacteria group bacterium]|nr:phosphatase PAP2 family protein [Parcubacteria group bacterium]